MGGLPLRTPTDRRHGGPLPRRQANRTHPHPSPAKGLSSESDAVFGPHAALIRLSAGCAADKGRLDTRYSPVRRSPSGNASIPHAAPRLACVKPVASVHPEPGSNSTLYNLFISLSLRNSYLQDPVLNDGAAPFLCPSLSKNHFPLLRQPC